ncbi:MAG: TadE/TadG family type IV pilus assembly protein [Sphingomicrobium sp.]
MTLARRLLRSTSGASAAEFGLVLPLFLLLLFGVIDAGRFMWESNEAEKATQVGARVAIVTDPLSSGLRDEDYAGKVVGGTTLAAGDTIPAAALGSVKCTSTGCTCETATCPSSLGTFNTTLFTDVIVTRMKQMYPSIKAENVVVRYKGSGFGIAEASGGAAGTEQMEISPLVTVTLTGVQFRPLTTFMFRSITMPDFATTLTAEDASGTVSN